MHNDAQDQVGQILKRGKIVICGMVGQTFLYGAKSGEVFVMGNFIPFTNADWRVIEPYLRENATLLGIRVEDLLEGKSPGELYRKVVAAKKGSVAGERGE